MNYYTNRFYTIVTTRIRLIININLFLFDLHTKMGRSLIDLSPYKDEIVDLFNL
jgi:hypothetical protein